MISKDTLWDSWSLKPGKQMQKNKCMFELVVCCLQVGKLYIRYQLDIADGEESVIELQDVICLLKDKKELYIQKDHLSAHLDICRFVCDGVY